MTTQNCMKMVVIANPQSAGGILARRWTSVQDRIREAFGPFDHVFTEAPRDATRLARKAIQEGYELVVALGGDGTISEVANGFYDGENALNPEAVLGILPFGTGGDLRKALNVERDLMQAAHALRGRATRTIDLGRLTHTATGGGRATMYFINIASFGIGGLVDAYVNTSPKFLGGTLSFMLATVRAQLRYQNQTVRLTLDGGRPFEMRILNVAVANGQYFGGGMQVAPWSSLDDGMFDVVMLGDYNAWEMVTRGYQIYFGGHMGDPKVRFERARRVEAEAVSELDAVLLDVDGETPGHLPAVFEVVPKALKVKVPD